MSKSMTLLQRVQEANRILGAGEKFTRSDLIQLMTEVQTELTNAGTENRVDVAAKTLSYSEIQGMQAIAPELTDGSGLIVASKIADRAGITRSVIVNALRKLESAGVIQSRSLGMKGTHIKSLIPGWSDRYLAA